MIIEDYDFLASLQYLFQCFKLKQNILKSNRIIYYIFISLTFQALLFKMIY